MSGVLKIGCWQMYHAKITTARPVIMKTHENLEDSHKNRSHKICLRQHFELSLQSNDGG